MISTAGGPWAYLVGPISSGLRGSLLGLSGSARLLRSRATQLTLLQSNYDAALSRVSSHVSCTGEGEVPQAQVKIGGKRRSQSGALVGIIRHTRGTNLPSHFGP
jgi:hypothetical protein